jgi:vitamin B12 transporter
LGMDYRFEHIFSNVLGETMDLPKEVRGYDDVFFTRSYGRSGLSFMAEQSVFQGPFSVSAGLLTYLSTDLEKGVSFFPGIDLGWQISQYYRWYSSFNRTLRLPTFTDLFYSGPTNVGNPDLKPEQAISFETGLKARWSIIDVDLALFRRWGTNMIDWIKEPGDEKWRSMNLTQVNLTGIETGISLPLGAMLGSGVVNPKFSMHYSYIYSDKHSGDFVSNYVLDHLQHKFDLTLTHHITAFAGATWKASWQQRAGGFMLYQDGVFQQLQDFDPFWMVDLRLFYQLRSVQLFAEASNLFNVDYVTIANVPQPGRWARIGLTVDFDLGRR